jgi:hypothetical protein
MQFALGGARRDMFPTRDKDRRNYATNCRVFQHAGLCPYFFEREDSARGTCAEDGGLSKQRVLRSPLDWSADFYERKHAAASASAAGSM